MDVRTIRDRIVELSHHGIGNDVDVKAQALAWLNSAYFELMDEMVPFLPDVLQLREDVVCDGQGQTTLQRDVYKLVKVVDVDGSRALPQATVADVLELDVQGVQGDPVRCSVAGNVLRVHPAKAASLAVVYVPQVAALAEDDVESAVLLPVSLHQVLVWGGLVWSALFDRGFMSQSELVLYQRQWQAGKEQVKLAMFGGGAPVRVKPFRLV